MNIKLVLLLSFFAPSAFARFDGSITYVKGDGRECHGTFIKSSGTQAMLTAAHCLDNFSTGGIRLQDGTRATEVFVADSVSSRGSASNDDDFALVIFPASNSRQAADYSHARQSQGATVVLVTARNGSRRSFRETVQGYTPDSTRSYDAFITTSNNSANLEPGDSGSAVYDVSDQLLGVLRGCVPELCGYFSIHTGNPVTAAVFQKARQRYPNLFSENPPPGPGPGPQPQRNYTCSSQCRIDYPDNTAYETVDVNLVRAVSANDAQGKAYTQLANYCQEFCTFSRDAVRCSLIGSISCN